MRDLPRDPTTIDVWGDSYRNETGTHRRGHARIIDLVRDNGDSGTDRVSVIRDVIDSLPPLLLEVVEAIAYESLSVTEAARRLDTSHTSIRRRLKAIGRLLEEALGDEAL